MDNHSSNRKAQSATAHLGTIKQRGGTLLGLIVGLIIGLGIAVVVAVTIKNTPLPFVNKLSRPAGAPEPAGQIGDPNKPLYGNGNAAKEAAKALAKKMEEEKAAKEAQNGGDAAKADAGAPVVDKSATPGADKQQASLEKPQKADNTGEKFTYYLQAGAFLDQGEAENAKAKLALLGVPANIAERKSDNGTLYRVRIGPFGQADTMNRMRGKLTDNGVDVAVVRVPK